MSETVQHIASIPQRTALRIVPAAVAAAEAAGQRSAIAVVDAAGHLTAFTRTDGAPVQASQPAQDKAYTAAGFGMPSGRWHEFMQHDVPLATGAPTAVDRLVPFGGGIGISGGHWSEDGDIAEAALEVRGQHA